MGGITSMKSLFLDMDGCLTEYKDVPVKALYEQGYFAELKPIINVVEGLRIFCEVHPDVKISILSCILIDRPNAVEEKVMWLKKHCPFLMDSMYFIPCGTDKSLIACDEDNYLLDDYSKNVLEFENASANHHGIKLLNGVNGKGVKWKGKTINSALSPYEFAKSLYEAIA